MTTCGRTKSELIRLMDAKVDLHIYKRKLEGEIKKLATALSIPFEMSYPEEIAGGESQATGSFQV